MSYKELFDFLYILVLGFLVGLELKTYGNIKGYRSYFGTVRTFTFITILGFVFYKIDFLLYLSGYLALSALYLIYYFRKSEAKRFSIITFLLLSLVYSFAPLIEMTDVWFVTLIYVLIVFILSAPKYTQPLLEKINMQEFETLGKFLLLSAVILPLLPHKELPYINISAFKIWLVVVVISSISYGSYIAQKYIFKNKGYLITGILGGLYSSTATTVVLAKKARFLKNIEVIEAAIVIATAMMYIRLLVIAFIFNEDVANHLLIPFLIFFSIAAAVALSIYKKEEGSQEVPYDDRNPLELGTAIVFAMLFIAMMLLTKFVTSHFGDMGLKILSFIVGFTDIDPFVLSLLTGKYQIGITQIAQAIMIAAGSNNILKAIYALVFGSNRPKRAAVILFLLGLATILYPFLEEFI